MCMYTKEENKMDLEKLTDEQLKVIANKRFRSSNRISSQALKAQEILYYRNNPFAGIPNKTTFEKTERQYTGYRNEY